MERGVGSVAGGKEGLTCPDAAAFRRNAHWKFLCAVRVHFTSGCKSRPRNCRYASGAIGRGRGP